MGPRRGSWEATRNTAQPQRAKESAMDKLKRSELLANLSPNVAGPSNPPDERTKALVEKSTAIVCHGMVDPREDIARRGLAPEPACVSVPLFLLKAAF